MSAHSHRRAQATSPLVLVVTQGVHLALIEDDGLADQGRDGTDAVRREAFYLDDLVSLLGGRFRDLCAVFGV